MRSFIISCIILLTIIVLICINTAYCNKKIDAMLVICAELRESSSLQKAEELFAFWQSCRDIISLSIHNTKIEEADDAIMSLISYTENKADFAVTLSLVTDTLNHIKESQSFTAKNIF